MSVAMLGTQSPSKEHCLTLIALHGFNSSGAEFEHKLTPILSRHVRNHTRILFPTAPRRKISCYNGTFMRAWHDYFTDYGDRDMEYEEEIDTAQLAESSAHIQGLVRSELTKCPKVVVLGESQGACLAIDVGLRSNIPVVALFGQRYAATPTNGSHTPLIFSLHGAKDTVIPPSVALKSLETIQNVHLKLVRGYAHADTGPAVQKFILAALGTVEAQ